MILLVGLGNPGKSYQNHRHNIGYMAIDAIADGYSFSAPKSKFQGQLLEGKIGTRKVLALKPQTYMNLSGQSVGEAVRFFKMPLEKVIVFHDELDLEPSKIRVKLGGGIAGHNGLRSLTAHLGQDFRRVRIGIGHPGDKALVHNYLLSNFAKKDKAWIEPLLKVITKSAPYLVKGEDERFMTDVAFQTGKEKK